MHTLLSNLDLSFSLVFSLLSYLESKFFKCDVYVFESIIIDSERGMKAPDKFNQEADGSWFISMKIDNDDIWKSVLDGTFKGFSVEGLFEESFVSQLESIFKKYKDQSK